jgi:hypothetical protein
MSKSIDEIIGVLNSISDVTTDADQLNRLDNAVNDITHARQPLLFIEPLLRIFERFPQADGFGVFWSILHRIEAMSGYEPFLLASIKREPSEFTIMMVNRIINGGKKAIEGVNLMSLLSDIEASANYSEGIRKTAKGFLEYQKQKA